MRYDACKHESRMISGLFGLKSESALESKK